MNKYEVILNYQGEITKMQTDAPTHYQSILNCLSIMAKKYGVKKRSMVNYFNSERLNCESKRLITNKDIPF